MRFGFIAVEKARHAVTRLCRCLAVTPSGFYAWRRRPESRHAREDRQVRVRVRTAFAESRGRYGSPRIHADLRAQQIRVSRKRVVRLMQADGLQARPRRPWRGTTVTDPGQPVAPNLLAQTFQAAAPNQRWVADTRALEVRHYRAKSDVNALEVQAACRTSGPRLIARGAFSAVLRPW